MTNHEQLTKWAIDCGFKLNGIRAHSFPGRGLGIVAEKNIEPGEVLMTIPMSVVRRAETVPKSISKSIQKSSPCSNNGLLAAELAQDQSDNYALWRESLPTIEDLQEAMPVMWEPELCQLIPPKAKTILLKQQRRIGQDWDAITAANLEIPMHLYQYYWLLINTRTFYYTPPRRETPPTDPDECLAIVPYGDYFNHSDAGCKVSYTRSQYSVVADRPYNKGEEVFVSYGAHSNDLLLAEYGFILEDNQWDEATLDEVVIPLFTEGQSEALTNEGYFANFNLDKEGACYRTKVALRLLCMPLGQWRRGLAQGFDDGDKYQPILNESLVSVFNTYREIVRARLEQISRLDVGLASQRDTLKRRWRQIDKLLIDATDQLRH
ncbi:hypothetical protein LTR96_010299 [Exophiala xenobiotica]|nr:hypothetical protein LTR96_010299 [Exophiala xenobiotica]KAK5333186.1 hypothetical protein LTR98_010713 [Exophiala xenobiotica]